MFKTMRERLQSSFRRLFWETKEKSWELLKSSHHNRAVSWSHQSSLRQMQQWLLWQMSAISEREGVSHLKDLGTYYVKGYFLRQGPPGRPISCWFHTRDSPASVFQSVGIRVIHQSLQYKRTVFRKRVAHKENSE